MEFFMRMITMTVPATKSSRSYLYFKAKVDSFPSIEAYFSRLYFIFISGDRGSYITLVGLASNVGLTIVKGVAGW
jgi:hypothetical protein